MENPATSPTKICPTCGTRISQDAPRCLVCGTTFTSTSSAAKSAPSEAPAIRGSRMPEITLSVPVILVMLFLFIVIGGGLTYMGLNATGTLIDVTPTSTPEATLPATLTPTPEPPTATITPQASYTPSNYIVQSGDSCNAIAFAFKISVQSIILENNLNAACGLFENQELKIPHPTFTPIPLATNTPGSAQATIDACETVLHVVAENENLGLIEASYGVPSVAIIEWNGKTTDSVYVGERIYIPLCMAEFVAGATVTPSPAPPYPAPELLLPRNGESFDLSNDTVALQWSSVGQLRENEFYQVTIIDLTSGENLQLVEVVRDTKFVVPTSFRPSDNKPHVFQWFVVAVARRGQDEDGNPTYDAGGAVSEAHYFTWSGLAPASTPGQ